MHIFYTVGDLKKALEGLPQDMPIICQVAATDGTAWNMAGVLYEPNEFFKRGAVLSLRHPELKTLPVVNIHDEYQADLVNDKYPS